MIIIGRDLHTRCRTKRDKGGTPASGLNWGKDGPAPDNHFRRISGCFLHRKAPLIALWRSCDCRRSVS
jgi:hypothetical protein